jgi:hypothetical protein
MTRVHVHEARVFGICLDRGLHIDRLAANMAALRRPMVTSALGDVGWCLRNERIGTLSLEDIPVDEYGTAIVICVLLVFVCLCQLVDEVV